MTPLFPGPPSPPIRRPSHSQVSSEQAKKRGNLLGRLNHLGSSHIINHFLNHIGYFSPMKVGRGEFQKKQQCEASRRHALLEASSDVLNRLDCPSRPARRGRIRIVEQRPRRDIPTCRAHRIGAAARALVAIRLNGPRPVFFFFFGGGLGRRGGHR